jgi:hypothetical protein
VKQHPKYQMVGALGEKNCQGFAKWLLSKMEIEVHTQIDFVKSLVLVATVPLLVCLRLLKKI